MGKRKGKGQGERRCVAEEGVCVTVTVHLVWHRVWVRLRGPGRRTTIGAGEIVKRPWPWRWMDGDGDGDVNQVRVRERDKRRAFGGGWCDSLNERRGSWTEADGNQVGKTGVTDCGME